MKVPVLQGIIERRILANYRVDPAVLSKVLPAPFEPKVIDGVGIAGICLIRLRHVKPRFVPGRFGLTSENAAHRIAVQWRENGTMKEGVYVPRRDTSSRFNTLVGGRLFPGVHNRARFDVNETGDHLRVELTSDDSHTHVLVDGRIAQNLPAQSVFPTLSEASAFFEAGSLGYSATPRAGEFDGLELRAFNWQVEPLAVDQIQSSYFEAEKLFPKGSTNFDCALVMRNIQHEWHGRQPINCPP